MVSHVLLLDTQGPSYRQHLSRLQDAQYEFVQLLITSRQMIDIAIFKWSRLPHEGFTRSATSMAAAHVGNMSDSRR